MSAIVNHAKQLVEADRLALGVGLRQARTVDTARAMKTAGFDWLFIDLEHNSMDVDFAVQLCIAAQDARITPLVRVPSFAHHHATRVLDGGAMGIVVPHVDDAETAARIASQCRYPPRGHRSVTGALPQLDFASRPLAEATAMVDQALLIVVMLETAQAIANAEAIAAIDGIDALLIGTNDLSFEMGIPGQTGHPDIKAAYRTAAAACKSHGKVLGMGGVYDPGEMADYIALGARLILAGSDFSFLMAGAKAQAQAVRTLLPAPS